MHTFIYLSWSQFLMLNKVIMSKMIAFYIPFISITVKRDVFLKILTLTLTRIYVLANINICDWLQLI